MTDRREIINAIKPEVLQWIADAQLAALPVGTAPAVNALLVDGSRQLAGNLLVAPGITLDGYSVSALGALPFLMLGNSALTPNERALAAGNGLQLTDGGAGAAATLAIDTGIVATLTGVQVLTNKTLTSPTIADLSNMQHSHLNAAGGGTLGAAAIASGQLALARGGTNADLSATGGAGQYLKQAGAGAAITVGTIPASDVASGAALTRVNDTNVTLTLGGTPSVALLAAASLTLAWTGTLALARGGSGADLSATGGAGQYVKQSGAGAALTVGAILAADLPGAFSGFANPSGLIGMAAVNGVATTADRSDATHAIDPAIAPSWSALHTYLAGLAVAAGKALTFGGDASLQRKSAQILQMGSGNKWQSSSFASGVSGFDIEDSGRAEFDNLSARGELRASMFTVGEKHAIGGTQMITYSAGVLYADATIF